MSQEPPAGFPPGPTDPSAAIVHVMLMLLDGASQGFGQILLRTSKKLYCIGAGKH